MRKCAAVRDAMRRGRPVLGDQLELLAKVGGRDFAALTGFLLQAVIRRIAGAAGRRPDRRRARCWCSASRTAPRSGCWPAAVAGTGAQGGASTGCRWSRWSTGYEVRQAEGALGLLALPMLKAAAALARSWQTFGEAGIPEPVLRSRV